MSNKPKIYANCKAGCLWEAVHQEDFLRSASIARVKYEEDGTYHLLPRETYKVKDADAKDEWGFVLKICYSIQNPSDSTGSIKYVDEVTLPAFDKYADSLMIRVLDLLVDTNSSPSIVYVVLEFDGVRDTIMLSQKDVELPLYGYYINYAIVEGATDCWLFNKGAEIEIYADEEFYKITEDHEERVVDLESKVADLLYEPITIKSFTNSEGTVEKGATITEVSLSWVLNKVAESVTVDGESQPTDIVGWLELTGQNITANKTFTIQATDERDATASKTTSISFVNRTYFGAAATFDTTALDSVLSESKTRTFTKTAGEGEYLWYAIPTRLGTRKFNVGGFDGGFSLIETTAITNASGYTEDYYVYRSDYANLGETKVVVS